MPGRDSVSFEEWRAYAIEAIHNSPFEARYLLGLKHLNDKEAQWIDLAVELRKRRQASGSRGVTGIPRSTRDNPQLYRGMLWPLFLRYKVDEVATDASLSQWQTEMRFMRREHEKSSHDFGLLRPPQATVSLTSLPTPSNGPHKPHTPPRLVPGAPPESLPPC